MVVGLKFETLFGGRQRERRLRFDLDDECDGEGRIGYMDGFASMRMIMKEKILMVNWLIRVFMLEKPMLGSIIAR